jgi:transcriptional regulator GlxA family with amidase domain
MEQRSGSTPAATPAHALGRLAKLFTLGLFADLASLEADYVNAVLWEAGGRMARIRLHFEYAIDVLVDALATGAEIEPATTRDLRQTVVDSLQRAASAQALARALRDALRSFTRITRTPRRSDLELRLARAARTIETQCSEPLTLATVARSVGLSANYFSERFKATHKVGFTAYLSRARVERAKYLLCNSPAAICRVSEECGFLSVPHFNRVFKSALGLTPSQFRERTGARHKSVA